MNKFNYKNFSFKTYFFYQFIFTVDFIIWLFLKFLPDSFVFNIAKSKIFPIPFFKKNQNRLRFRTRLKKHLLHKQHQCRYSSSCLSLTLTGKVLCDLFAIKNEIHLGMLIYPDKRRIPHAWLVDPIDGIEITTKLVNGAIDILELHKL